MYQKKTRSISFKRSLLAMSIITIGSPSLSQAAEKSTADVEEVVITGLRSSISSAQDIKRNASTVEDVITASDIGALPDKSVTEALQRVPGITISRFAAGGDPNHSASEGRGVLVRGLDRVRSEFNGRDSFSANSDSGLNYEDIPPELLGAVKVVKNQTADLTSGGIAGTVNLVTRKPFDSADRLAAFSLKETYGDLVDKYSPSYSGLFSDRWETSAGEFGALLAGSVSTYNSRSDGVAIENFYTRSATQKEFPSMGSTALKAAPNDTLYLPYGADVRTDTSDRDRKGFDLSLQWKNPGETLVATAEFINNRSIETWHEHVVFSGIQGFSPNIASVQLADVDPNTAGVQTDAHFDSNGFFTDGTISHGDPYLASTRSSKTDNKLNDASFHVTFTPDDKLKVDLDVQHAKSTAAVINNSITNSFRAGDQHIDVRGNVPKVTFVQDTTALDAAAPEKYFQSSILDTNINAEGTLSSYKIDGAYQVDSGWFKSVSTGLYFSDRDDKVKDDNYANWQGVSATWAGNGLKSGLVQPGNDRIYEPYTFGSDFFNGDVIKGKNNTFLFPRVSDTMNIVAYDKYLIDNGISNIGYVNRQDRVAADGSHTDSQGYLPNEIYDTKQTHKEAYVRFDFANDELKYPIKSNLGLRYVNYQVEASGASVFSEIVPASNSNFYPSYLAQYPQLAAFFNKSASSTQTQKPDAFNTVLPSLNVSVEFSDEFITRFAASKALYYPGVSQLRNAGTYLGSYTQQWLYDDLSKTTASWACDTWSNPGTPRCNKPTGVKNVGYAGFRSNPALKPEQANQFDVTAEWYFSKSDSLTATLFYKKISDLFREDNFTETVTNPSNGKTLDILVRHPVNKGEGTIKGAEFAYTQFYDFLPGAWSGLGLQLNYTYVDQADLNEKRGDLGAPNDLSAYGDNRNTFRNFSGLALPNLSKNTYNAVLIYEHADISARLAYNWRSQYLLVRRDADSFAPIYADAAGYLDASLWYTINDHIKVGFEGSNLLGQLTKTLTQFDEDKTLTPKTFFSTDRRYTVSLRATF